MLAWLRTGIATIGLGFLVARFGYFMMVMRGGAPGNDLPSKLIGIGLVALGTIMIGLSGWQHRRFLSVLQSESLPPQYSARLSLVLATLMCLCGIALAFYLASASKGSQRSDPPKMSAYELVPTVNTVIR
jgi:putative membrane protein